MWDHLEPKLPGRRFPLILARLEDRSAHGTVGKQPARNEPVPGRVPVDIERDEKSAQHIGGRTSVEESREQVDETHIIFFRPIAPCDNLDGVAIVLEHLGWPRVNGEGEPHLVPAQQLDEAVHAAF